MRFRFSLMTLLSLVLFAGSGVTFWRGTVKWQRKFVHVAPWKVSSVSFSPKGNRLAVGDISFGSGRFVRVFDTESGSLLLDYDSEVEKALKFNICGHYELGADVSRNEKMRQIVGWIDFSPNGDFITITKLLNRMAGDTCVVVKRLDGQPMNNLFPVSLPKPPQFHRDGLGAHFETFDMVTSNKVGPTLIVNFKTGETFEFPSKIPNAWPDDYSFFTDNSNYLVITRWDGSHWRALSVLDGRQVEISEHVDRQDRVVPLRNTSSFAVVDHNDPSHIRVFHAESGVKEFDTRGPAQAASARIDELYLKEIDAKECRYEVWRLGGSAPVCRIDAGQYMQIDLPPGNDRLCYARHHFTAFDTQTGRIVWQKDKSGQLSHDSRFVLMENSLNKWNEVCDARTGQTISRFDPKEFPGSDADVCGLSFNGRLMATVKGNEVTVWESNFPDNVGRQWLRMPGLWLSIVSMVMLLRSVFTDRRKFAKNSQ